MLTQSSDSSEQLEFITDSYKMCVNKKLIIMDIFSFQIILAVGLTTVLATHGYGGQEGYGADHVNIIHYHFYKNYESLRENLDIV